MNIREYAIFQRDSLVNIIYETCSQKQKLFSKVASIAEEIYLKNRNCPNDIKIEELLHSLKVMLQYTNQDISAHIDLALQSISSSKRISLQLAPKILVEDLDIISDELKDRIRLEKAQKIYNTFNLNEEKIKRKENANFTNMTSLPQISTLNTNDKNNNSFSLSVNNTNNFNHYLNNSSFPQISNPSIDLANNHQNISQDLPFKQNNYNFSLSQDPNILLTEVFTPESYINSQNMFSNQILPYSSNNYSSLTGTSGFLNEIQKNSLPSLSQPIIPNLGFSEPQMQAENSFYQQKEIEPNFEQEEQEEQIEEQKNNFIESKNTSIAQNLRSRNTSLQAQKKDQNMNNSNSNSNNKKSADTLKKQNTQSDYIQMLIKSAKQTNAENNLKKPQHIKSQSYAESTSISLPPPYTNANQSFILINNNNKSVLKEVKKQEERQNSNAESRVSSNINNNKDNDNHDSIEKDDRQTREFKKYLQEINKFEETYDFNIPEIFTQRSFYDLRTKRQGAPVLGMLTTTDREAIQRIVKIFNKQKKACDLLRLSSQQVSRVMQMKTALTIGQVKKPFGRKDKSANYDSSQKGGATDNDFQLEQIEEDENSHNSKEVNGFDSFIGNDFFGQYDLDTKNIQQYKNQAKGSNIKQEERELNQQSLGEDNNSTADSPKLKKVTRHSN